MVFSDNKSPNLKKTSIVEQKLNFPPSFLIEEKKTSLRKYKFTGGHHVFFLKGLCHEINIVFEGL
jgi:hypothetical protein